MFDVPNDEAARRALMLRREHDTTITDLPERRLMVALFGDAIRCIEKYRNARDARSKTRLAKELQWVLSDDSQSLFAFVRVCEVLDLDPLAVRRSLGLLGDARGTRTADESAEERRLRTIDDAPPVADREAAPVLPPFASPSRPTAAMPPAWS